MSLRLSGRTVVIHSPLSAQDARARIRRELAGESVTSMFVEIEPGWYVLGWIQADGFKLMRVRRLGPIPGQIWGWTLATPWLRGTIHAEGEGCRLEGRFDPTTYRTRWGRREDASMRDWLAELLDGEER